MSLDLMPINNSDDNPEARPEQLAFASAQAEVSPVQSCHC